MRELKERLGFIHKKIGKAIGRRLFGPSVLDRDFPDPRPPNEARDRLLIAQIISQIETKEGALGLVYNSTIGLWTDYNYQVPFHEQVRARAGQKAMELGATDEEVREAIGRGNISGATMRSGMED